MYHQIKLQVVRSKIVEWHYVGTLAYNEIGGNRTNGIFFSEHKGVIDIFKSKNELKGKIEQSDNHHLIRLTNKEFGKIFKKPILHLGQGVYIHTQYVTNLRLYGNSNHAIVIDARYNTNGKLVYQTEHTLHNGTLKGLIAKLENNHFSLSDTVHVEFETYDGDQKDVATMMRRVKKIANVKGYNVGEVMTKLFTAHDNKVYEIDNAFIVYLTK